MQGIFQKENTDKALKYGIYRHLPTYEKIIRNLVSFYTKKATKTSVLHKKDSNYDIKIKRLYADDVGICGKVIIIQKAMNKNVNVEIRYNSKQGGK